MSRFAFVPMCISPVDFFMLAVFDSALAVLVPHSRPWAPLVTPPSSGNTAASAAAKATVDGDAATVLLAANTVLGARGCDGVAEEGDPIVSDAVVEDDDVVPASV